MHVRRGEQQPVDHRELAPFELAARGEPAPFACREIIDRNEPAEKLARELGGQPVLEAHTPLAVR